MKKFLIILFTFCICLNLRAQIATIFSTPFPDSAKTTIGIAGEYGANSNSLTNTFVNKFYNGGYIDKQLKDEVLARTQNENRFGGDLNDGIYCAIKLDSLFHKKNFSLFFSLRDRLHTDAQFSRDLYKVGFYGNAAYAGKTANFNGFNFNLIRYQQIQIGLFSSKFDNAARWGIGLSFLKGEQYLSISAPKAELYTSEDGQYIDFNTSMQVIQSDTAHTGFAAFNGYGASLDVFFEAPFKSRLGNSKLTVSASDIGFIRFNSQTLYLKQDSLFHYSGFKVTSINDLQDSTIGNTSKDSIIQRVAPFKKQAFNATLPAVLNLTFETEFTTRFHLTEGIRYVFNANYKLLVYVKANFYLNKKMILSTTIGHGGYGNFSYGIGLFANFGKQFFVNIGSNNIEGFIQPRKTCGQGTYIALIKKF